MIGAIAGMKFEGFDPAGQSAGLAIVDFLLPPDCYDHIVTKLAGIIDGPV
jgi:hypothetical protein